MLKIELSRIFDVVNEAGVVQELFRRSVLAPNL